MPKRPNLREKLTYANVMSTIAVFLVVSGGAAYAAIHLPKNSVGSPQIKKNAVKTGDIARNAVKVGKLEKEAVKAGKLAKNAVATNRLRSNAVTGAKVNESTLGAVPGAVNSQKLGGLSAEQIIAAATPACPAGTKLSLGLCFEESPRAPKPYEEAIYDCKEVGRRLPSEGELAAYETQNYTEPPPGEWVGPRYFDGTSTVRTTSARRRTPSAGIQSWSGLQPPFAALRTRAERKGAHH